MFTSEPEILNSSLNFLYEYTQKENIYEEIKKSNAYKKKPLFFYLKILLVYSPTYQKYYRDLTHLTVNNLKLKLKQLLKREPDTIDLFLKKCWDNKTEYNRLRGLSNPSAFSQEEINQINQISSLENPSQQTKLFKNFFKNRPSDTPTPSTTQSTPTPQLSKISLSKATQLLKGKVVAGAKKLISQHQLAAGSLLSGGVGAGVGAFVGGLGLNGGITGALVGGGAGLSLPILAKSKTFFTVLRGGGELALKGLAGLSNSIGWVLLAPSVIKKGGWIVIIIGVVFLLIIFLILQQTTALFPPFETTANIPPEQKKLSFSDIEGCKFTRSDQNPKEAMFKSSSLLNYIQEAAQVSGIPPAVLAAFIRVESPSSVNLTNESLSSYGCPESQTGALGIMQLQPQGTRGHDAGAIAQGAAFINKKYTELTRDDYCDLRKNILMGAGFVLKKMSYNGYGDGTRWDPSWTNNKQAIESLVKSYYGCLEYGGKNPLKCEGPYNYADDVWTSIQSCQADFKTTPHTPQQSTVNNIVEAASQITKLLVKAWDSKLQVNLYSKKSDEPMTPVYWCTYLIVDSYNKVGLSGLNRSDHGGVLKMKLFFQNTSGYQLLPPETRADLLYPGDVVFFEGSGRQHVSLIKYIELEKFTGNGAIFTYDSNNIVTEDKIWVVGYTPRKAQTTEKTYSITGFGRAIK